MSNRIINFFKGAGRSRADFRRSEAILTIVADAANSFLKTSGWSPEDWDQEINTLLERLGATIHASHVYIFENHPSPTGDPLMTIRYEWTAPGLESDLGNPRYVNKPLDEDYIESWDLQIRRGEPFIGDLNHISLEEMSVLDRNGIKALLDVPIMIDGSWWGVIGFDDVMESRKWSGAEVDALVAAANFIGAAIKRQQLDAMLQNELHQRKRLIEELEAKNAELERFSYTVSHDLRAPLVTIRGFLGYLERNARLGNMNSFERDLRRIESATDRMDDLLKGLLELSRIGRLINAPGKVSFRALAEEAAEIVHGQLEARRVTLRIQPDLPIVYGDRARLVEALQNLIENAIKYMGDQKKPLIEIGMNGRDNVDAPIFFVRDNGVGIAPEYHERIFRLFDKLDVSTDGTGIGLALVKRIIEFHGGRIWVESEAGVGSTFLFTLPSGLEPDSVI
ncbi:MAG: GAF domain-containing sensor histidine kinase [Chloroflexi bacterium]|nr:GAF domain-containing sensor histidine kinase [Chloroflexota bacterium]